MTGMILDALLMLLLVAAIAYGVRLEKKLVLLRDGQAAFGRAVGELNGAVGRAETALASLKDAGEEADLLHDRILKGRALKDELETLVRKASRAEPRAEPAIPTPTPTPLPMIAPERAPVEGRARIEALFAQARGRIDAQPTDPEMADSLFEPAPRATRDAATTLQALAANHAAQRSLNRPRPSLDEDLFAA